MLDKCVVSRSLAILIGFLALALTSFAVATYFLAPGVAENPALQAFLARQLSTSIAIAVVVSAVAYLLWTAQFRRLQGRQQKILNLQHDVMAKQMEALSSQAATCILDPSGRVEAASDGFVDMLGTSAGALLGQPLVEAVPCLQDSRLHRMLSEAREHGRFVSGEVSGYPTDRPGRMVVHVTVIPQFDREGAFSQILLVLADKTQEKMSETDRFLGLMLEELQEEIYVYEAGTLAIRYMNQSARQRLGWSPAEARARKISDTVPNFDMRALEKHIGPLVEQRQNAVTIEVSNAGDSVEIVTRKMTGTDGVDLFVSSLRDLSHRHEIEAAKLQTVSMVSHELRSPLASIKGSLSLLKSGSLGEIPAPVEKVLDIADRNSDRLLVIVNDILDFEKIRSGTVDFSTADTGLHDLLHEAVDVNQPYADRHGVTLRVAPVPADARVEVSQDRIMQVLTNLLSNAIKFSDPGDTVLVCAEGEGGNWRISVTDTGPGMPEQAIADIGKPFHQQVPVDGRKREGTGLGLTIVKQILGHHGTKLAVESTVGTGSTFSFALPAATPSADGAAYDGLDGAGDTPPPTAIYS